MIQFPWQEVYSGNLYQTFLLTFISKDAICKLVSPSPAFLYLSIWNACCDDVHCKYLISCCKGWTLTLPLIVLNLNFTRATMVVNADLYANQITPCCPDVPPNIIHVRYTQFPTSMGIYYHSKCCYNLVCDPGVVYRHINPLQFSSVSESEVRG